MRRTVAPVSGNVHSATLDGITPIADGVVEYRFALAAEDVQLSWRPGQFVSLTCGKDADGQPLLRSYSIASSPGTGILTLIVKLIPGGAASTWLERLRLGDAIRFTGPMGFFVLDLAHAGDVVFGATGTGIAPVVPMLRELLARDEHGRIELHWGVRHEADLFWRDELAALAHPRLAMTIYVSQPRAGWTGPVGRVSRPLVEALAGLERPVYYLVGNGAMIREVKAELQARGVDRKKQIRTEAFFD